MNRIPNMPSCKLNLRDRLEDTVLDLSMSQIDEVPVREIVSWYGKQLWHFNFNSFLIICWSVVETGSSYDLSWNMPSILGLTAQSWYKPYCMFMFRLLKMLIYFYPDVTEHSSLVQFVFIFTYSLDPWIMHSWSSFTYVLYVPCSVHWSDE
jgi:hypothetical protein